MAKDVFYDDAVAFVRETGRASIIALQRKLRLGYSRTAEIVESMEANGVITEPGMNGARTVIGYQDPETLKPPLEQQANEAHRKAEQTWYAYACTLDVGPQRERAFQIYENIRVATRVPMGD